jgi:hypothetical protein
MRLNLVKPRAAPVPPYNDDLVEIDTEAIPYMLGALWLRSQRYNWITTDDARRGRQLLAKQGAQLLMSATDKIVAAIDRVYTLLGGTVLGRSYGIAGDGTPADPYRYDPPLPMTVDHTAYGDEGIMYYQVQQWAALANLATGNPTGGYTDNRNIRQQLEDLIAATQANAGQGLDDEMLAKLAQIALALA